jgi:hypothetical protein
MNYWVSPRLIGKAFGFTVLLGGTWLAFCIIRIANNTLAAKSATAVIEVNAGELDLGDVWEEESFSRTFTLQNRTSSDVLIREFLCSRKKVRVIPQSVVVPASGSATVVVKADLTNECYDGDADKQPFYCQIIAITDQGEQEVHWELKGYVRPVIVSAERIRFENLVQGRSAHSAFVQATVRRPNTQLRVKQHNHVCKSIEVVETDPGRQLYTIKLDPRTDLSPGWVEDFLELEAIEYGGESLLTRRIPIDGRVEAVVSVLPNPILLGIVECGSVVDTTLTLTGETTDQRFRVVGFDLPEGMSIQPLDSDDNTRRFRLRFSATSAGHVKRTVNVRIQTSDNVEQSLVVDLFGYGKKPGG